MITRFLYLLLVLSISLGGAHKALAQSPGDTIRVQAFEFDNTSRNMMVSFPDNDNLTYEKILLKYTMRCKDGLISNSTDRNRGCGEWDYSCNTYLVDSTKVESQPTTIASHFISDYTGSSFEYIDTPVYDYIRTTQQDVQIVNTINEEVANIGRKTEQLDRVLSTNNLGGRSQFLYTAQELSDRGIVAGPIQGLSVRVSTSSNAERFFSIRMKNIEDTVIDGLEEFTATDEVYAKKQQFVTGQENRFQLHTPFMWDGTSNVLVEYTLTNAESVLSPTTVFGEVTSEDLALVGVSEQDVMLANNGYIECDEYTGFAGTQNRTIEAWIKTTNGRSGEIMNWGRNSAGEKFTIRFANGALRVEINGGGTVGTTRIDDGQWHHIAVVLDGNSLSGINFYIDGVLDTRSAVGTNAINTDGLTTKLRINRGLLNRYFDATIDDVRVWDTDLSAETIETWKNLKVDKSHPNYDNLQLHYELEGAGNEIIDSSPFGRNATLIGGNRFSISEVSGEALFKNFEKATIRPSLNFYQGEYETEVVETIVDRPVAKTPRHMVIERTIVPGDPNVVADDDIIVDGPRELWTPVSNIYDETGALIETIDLPADGVIDVADLSYVRRFPFYNELVSFVTPYGIGLDLGLEGATWEIDLSDYVSILNGDRRLQMTLGGQNQEQMDLEFLFVVGTPPRDVIQYEQIWQGTNRIGSANINQILADQKFAPIDIQLSTLGEKFKIRSSITGHGAEGEFQQNGGVVNHFLTVNQTDGFDWRVNKECSFNPIFPQGGTWVYDRQGWCPGEQSLAEEHNLSQFADAGETVSLDYYTSSAPNPTGDYRYHVAHQLVGYGPANFQTDAAVTRIVAPNNSAEFTRVGTVCANPTIVIQNTGAEELTSLTINYWLNESQSPQSYEWTGSLAFLETQEVVIPSTVELWYDVLADGNKFYVEVSAPNGGADEYTFNNTYTSEFDYPDILPNGVTVEFRTNNRPLENSYELLDNQGNVMGTNGLPASNTIYADDYNLADGCYRLVVNDNGGDGVQWWANQAQGTGFVRLKDANGSILRTFEPDFGGGFEYSFSTTSPLAIEELEFLTSINVFPNPSTDYINIDADELKGSKVYLINAMGRRVSEVINADSNNTISMDVNHLNSGLFYIVIEKDQLVTTRKVVVE